MNEFIAHLNFALVFCSVVLFVELYRKPRP